MTRLIRRRSGKDTFSQMQDDFYRLLAPFDYHYQTQPEESLREWAPSIDVKEEEGQFIIHVDVPGVKAADIDVSMDNGVLTIKGNRHSESKSEKENYLRIERSSGSFMRQMVLPEAVDQDRIHAKCSDGVLEINLPKTNQSIGRKIEVREN